MSRVAPYWPDEFRKRRLHKTAPSVEAFVADHGPIPITQLAEILILDQSFRWELGEQIHAESYLARFPDILEHPESAIDIVFYEFLLSERADLEPDINEFVRRFPQFADELQRQASFHRAIGSEIPKAAMTEADPVEPGQSGSLPGRSGGKFPEIHGYEILAELGRGAIGIVYRARHEKLSRHTALKMLLAGNFAGASQLRRFMIEAEATARLQHANIVQIYEVGQHDGRPFLALELINGGTLSQWTRGRPQPARDAAAIVQVLAEAVQFAHDQGVVHRDLKPANVLVQRLDRSREEGISSLEKNAPHIEAHPAVESRRPVSESSFLTESALHQEVQLKIADFGLAKLLDGGSDKVRFGATMTGDVMGTAAYMSPEQARGDGANITGATDIYSLGAILYELLTGRPPFVGFQPLEVMGQVIADEPVNPSQLIRHLPRDIQAICLKCLEKSPARRYVSAEALADDLERFLTDQPIVARHASSFERGRRWCRRHPVKTMLAASTAIMLAMIATISVAYSVKLSHQLALTSEARNKEQLSKIDAQNQLWESRLSQADAIRTSNQVGQRYDALAAIEAARGLGDSIEFSAQQNDRMRNATVACLALPDLRNIRDWSDSLYRSGAAIASDRELSVYAYVTEDGSARICRTTDSAELVRIPAAGVDAVPLFSSDGKRLAIFSEDCRVYRLDYSEPKLVFTTPSIGAWGFTPDGKMILGTGSDGLLGLVDLTDGAVVKTFGALNAYDQVSISPDARRAAVFDGQSVQVIDLESGETILQIENALLRGRKHFAWNPDSNLLAIGPKPNVGIELWDVEVGVRVANFYHDAGELEVSFSSTGERLLTFDVWSKSLLVWDVSSGEMELSSSGDGMRVVAANSSGGFKLLQFTGEDQFSLAAIEHPRVYRTLPTIHRSGTTSLTNDLAYSADGRILAIVSRGELQIVDMQSYRELNRLVTGYCFVQFAPDGSLLTSTESGLVRWPRSEEIKSDSSGNGSLLIRLGPPEYLSDTVAYSLFDVSRDGETIAVPLGNELELKSKNHPQWPETIGPHADVRRVSISPDGRRVATGGWEGGQVCVWDIPSGRLLHTFDEPDCCLVKFSPDGKHLVTVADHVKIWNVESCALVRKLPVAGGSVSGVTVCFSGDGRLLAVSDSTSRIHLFDPASGRNLLTLTDPNRQGAALMTFSPVESQLAVFSGAQGGVVHVWDLAALEEELGQRDLDWPARDSVSSGNRADADQLESGRARYISGIEFENDDRFNEIESVRQLAQLELTANDPDSTSARIAIARLTKLQPQRASTCNAFAWMLATGPQHFRDPAKAVEFARRAVEAESTEPSDRANCINTLGVALYRADRIADAIAMLEKSLTLQPPASQPFDLFFLAMCHARNGERLEARNDFDQARTLIRENKQMISDRQLKELESFEQEARLLLDETFGETTGRPD